LLEAEQTLGGWVSSLPDHLRFSEENLQVQLSMLETGSNMGAWCFCSMHVVHASCTLALNLARHRGQRGSVTAVPWAVARLETIVSSIGPRARNSIILGAALWSLCKYCQKDDSQVRKWSADLEELWGVRIQDLISTEWGQQLQSSSRPRPMLHPVSNPIPIPVVDRNGVELISNGTNLSVSSPPTYPSLRRSLNELRLHNKSVHGPSSNDSDSSRKSAGDMDIDPLSQNGSIPRSLDGPQSLPSLKASGLLDSWSIMSTPGGGSTWMGGRPDSQSHGPSPPRMKTPPVLHTNFSDSSRTSSSGMPVGLPWLANESR